MKMSCLVSLSSILIVLVVAISCGIQVEATRVLHEDFASMGKNDFSIHPLFDRAKYNMVYLLGRLASGPSDGAGH